MRHQILTAVHDSVRAVEQLAESRCLDFIQSVAELLARCFSSGNKVLIAGNGGSLCDAAHFAEELTGYFRTKRAALPAIALTEPGHITCVSNDSGFDQVFARAVQAYGKTEDVFIGLTTSGNSQNIIHAVEQAEERGLSTVLFLGKGGGKLKGRGLHELLIEGFSTSDRIQEAHMAAIHMIIEQLETLLFQKEKAACACRGKSIGVL